jgi:hypothetical protein
MLSLVCWTILKVAALEEAKQSAMALAGALQGDPIHHINPALMQAANETVRICGKAIHASSMDHQTAMNMCIFSRKQKINDFI